MKLLVFGKPELRVDQIGFDKLLKRCRQADWQLVERAGTSRDDMATMAIYDVVQTPAMVIVQDDGKPSQIWQHRVPSYEEMATYYL